MSADLVIRGGRVFTGRVDGPFSSAVAVAGDRIVAIGDAVDDLIGRGTRVVELEGAMATPGFIDAHVHPVSSGLDLLRCHFTEDDDAQIAVQRIADYAAEVPDRAWIVGSGWLQSWFPRGCPSKELIDGVVSDRPVLLENTDGHGAWANSRALEVAGIDRDTPDPMDGRIERLEDGSPQGTLHEGAVRLVAKFAPEDTPEEILQGLLRGQALLHGFGITGWQDASITPAIQDAYLRASMSGQLTGRVVGALWWDRNRGLDQIEELVARREHGSPRFRPTSVKLMLDGVCENFTASMLEPYLDERGNATDNPGIDFIDRRELPEIVAKLDALGFQCHFHAIGDGAVRSALDAVAFARRRNVPNDQRHHVAHLQVVHPDDIPRFAALDVVANAQPLWACNDDYQTELTRPFLGEQRYGWQYPFRSLVEAGASLGMGSDWGVSTPNVMRQIDVAVNRTCPAGEPLVADEGLSLLEALTAFTTGSAYINDAERDTGSLVVGKLADLAVLDRDPIVDGPIREANVTMTVVGGEIVYEES